MIYTLKQWEEEEKIRQVSYHPHYGSCHLPCPNCKVIGFYAPRKDGDRKYRACKFCGFWQNVGEEPFRCEAVFCPDCDKPFGWHRKFTGQACDNCGGTNKVRCPWAVDCFSHPFWQKKQEFEKCTMHKYNQK